VYVSTDPIPELSLISPMFETVTWKAFTAQNSRTFFNVLVSLGIRFRNATKPGNIAIAEKVNRCSTKDEGET